MTKIEQISIGKQICKAASLTARITGLESVISHIDEMQSTVLQCRKGCETQDTRFHSLKRKVDDIENHSRLCNIVSFFCIEDKDVRESYDAVEEKVFELCSSNLKCENIAIKRAHRLGKLVKNQPRPAIANFALVKDKQAVLPNAKKLKVSTIRIPEDVSADVRMKRKQLLKYSMEKCK